MTCPIETRLSDLGHHQPGGDLATLLEVALGMLPVRTQATDGPRQVAKLLGVDPDSAWTVEGKALASRSDNTPYEAMELPATVTMTLLRGKVTARDGKSPA